MFFRAETLPQALTFIKALGGFAQGPAWWHMGLFLNPKVVIVLCLGLVGVTPIVPWLLAWRERVLATRQIGPVAVDDGVEVLVSLVFMPAVFVCFAPCPWPAGLTTRSFIFSFRTSETVFQISAAKPFTWWLWPFLCLYLPAGC